MSEDNKYTLVINKKIIPVTEEVYKAYYRQREREAYLNKISRKHDISLEEYREKGIQVDSMLAFPEKSIEDRLIKAEMLKKMAEGMEILSVHERFLIYSLIFKCKSERLLSAETGIPQRTINDRKRKALHKLKKFIEK